MGVRKYGVCSDITTTYPINGKFSKFQKDIYDAVLLSQKKAISLLKPGKLYRDISEVATMILIRELLKLGIF